MEAVFVDDSDSEGDAVNPDSEAEVPSSEGEVEEDPGQSTSTSTAASSKAPAKKRSKKRALKKAEKKLLLQRIRGVSTMVLWQEISCRLNESVLSDFESIPEQKNGDSSKSAATAVVLNHDHRLVMQVLSYPTTKSLEDIVLHLRDTFVKVYSNCEGRRQKEKYCAFQLEWHKYCSAFLLEKALPLEAIGLAESQNKDLAKNRANWVQFCESVAVDREAGNRVMMVICAAVYDTLLLQVSKFIREEILGGQSTSNQISHQDSDDVLYRFCGAALASMLHARYKRIQTCPLEKKDIISQEITLLQSINSKSKSHIPKYLQYRDRGFMYFPAESFLPFLRAVDTCVRKYTNSTCYQRHGSQIVEITHQELQRNAELKSLFTAYFPSRLPSFHFISSTAVEAVYLELTRKLCNTRIQEFLDSSKQIESAKAGKGTLKGQNLRDNLLSKHVNLKSKCT